MRGVFGLRITYELLHKSKVHILNVTGKEYECIENQREEEERIDATRGVEFENASDSIG